MKGALIAIALAAGLATGPAAAGWDAARLVQVQAQKGRGGPPPERSERSERPRDTRQERQDDHRDRMTEDERRSLHRDLDKANREIYGRRPQK